MKNIPPPPTDHRGLLSWARRLYNALTSPDAEFNARAQSVSLRHQVSSELSRAVEDGIIEFDPVQQTIVVSVNGAWVPVTLGTP